MPQDSDDKISPQRHLHMMQRYVFSQINTSDAVAEYLGEEGYHLENLSIAGHYLMYKKELEDMARSYAAQLKDRISKYNYSSNLAKLIDSMNTEDAINFWYELSHSGFLDDDIIDNDGTKPNLFFGSNSRIPLSELSNSDFIKMMYGSKEPPADNFANALTYLMKENKIKISELAEKTGIDDRTIRRMRNNVNYRPSFKKVVAICIAMHLYPRYSNQLLSLAGLTPRYNNAAEKIYMILLYLYYESSVYECNEFLRKVNIEPLTDL